MGDTQRLLLSVPETARRLDIGDTLCWRLVHSGVLPSVRLGRSVRIPVRELERWIATQSDAVAIHSPVASSVVGRRRSRR